MCMTSANILNVISDLERCRIKVFKPKETGIKTSFADWENVVAWSGGEKYTALFVTFITIISYIRSRTIDWIGFEVLIDYHADHGTSTLLVMGSAGEVTMLTVEERREIIKRVSKYAKGKIPVFFGATFPTTEETIKFSQYAEAEGADGLVYTAPPYLLPPQTALAEHLLACAKSVSIPVGVYNNPSRVGAFILSLA